MTLIITEITLEFIHQPISFGGPTFQVGWSLKFTSRLLFATGGSLLPDSHLYLPPHLCGACCATGRNRLPVVVVRNPFSRLASGWRPLATWGCSNCF